MYKLFNVLYSGWWIFTDCRVPKCISNEILQHSKVELNITFPILYNSSFQNYLWIKFLLNSSHLSETMTLQMITHNKSKGPWTKDLAVSLDVGRNRHCKINTNVLYFTWLHEDVFMGYKRTALTYIAMVHTFDFLHWWSFLKSNLPPTHSTGRSCYTSIKRCLSPCNDYCLKDTNNNFTNSIPCL